MERDLFRFQAFGFALIWLALLWVLVLWMTVLFYRVKPWAGYLQIPYLVWDHLRRLSQFRRLAAQQPVRGPSFEIEPLCYFPSGNIS